MAKYKKRKDGRYATSIYLNKKRFYVYGKTICVPILMHMINNLVAIILLVFM